MRIVADQRIIGVKEAFSSLGQVQLLSPADLASTQFLGKVDTLLLRSDLDIDAALLRKCQPSFVGSPSTGIDHVDFDLLEEKGIGFAHAPGANADSVRDYIVAVLLHVSRMEDRSLGGKTLGIVGVGDIGSRVSVAAAAMGMRILMNDPPRAERDSGFNHLSLQQVVQESDILTLHVPLVQEGAYPTLHLFGVDLLSQMKEGSLLINASRGPVVETQALKSELKSGRIRAALDVWEREPEIDWELLGLVDFGTPHVAGQAVDGKLISTEMIYDACCHHFGIIPTWKADSLLTQTRIEGSRSGSIEERIGSVVSLVYDVESDYQDLKAALQIPLEQRSAVFRTIREDYLERREFVSHTIVVEQPCAFSEVCAGLGFQLDFRPPERN
jgi:erythronate-4-phosphate dehydrogenase